ncbi:type II secretion system secretin GspD [Phytohalomonas tamaricis]|uniref:type II secretion system secretin GspD n=1 Tax=Phytohalomonas tamaricis TaxID=2081032 RepID=UPI000D0AEA17|nr:type II secretion system secretin GspD [Phytohalomonas tamaricis]
MKFRHTFVAFLLTATVSSALAQTIDSTANESDAPRYEIDYNDVSLQEFIDSVGRITGKHFIVDPRVRGNISLESQRSLNADELYRVFQNQLQINGYATVELGDDQVRIVPDQVARTQPLPLGSESDSGNVMATQVIESQHLDAATLANILQPLVDARVGTITPYPDSNMVVVTDWRDNLQRLTRLATLLDGNRDTSAEVVSLKSADAEELAETIDSALKGAGGNTRVIAAPSANALVVFGNQRDRQRAQRLIAALDKPSEHQSTNTRVIYLNHASAETVVDVLRNLRDGGGGSYVSSTKTTDTDTVVRSALGISAGDEEASSGNAASALDSGSITTRALSVPSSDSVAFAVHPSTNALVLTGPPSQLDAYQSIIERLDIRRAQVAVEAIIAEITESRARELGVQWLFADTSGSGTFPVGSVNYSTSSSAGINQLAAAVAADDTSTLGSLLSSLNGATVGVGRLSDSGISFAALLNALRSDTDTNLLSTPSLTTLDNAEAYILVGQEVPFVTGSTTVDNANPYQTIEREDVGISLHIRPSISADNTIRMEITQEVSSIADNVDASDVVTNKREIETTVLAQDGGIIVLGGLISNQSSNTQQHVPLLGDIPVIGNLFRYSSRSNEKQNLMVFIRARVLRDAQTLNAVTAEKYRFMRAQQLLNDFDADQTLPELDAQATHLSLSRLYPSARDRLGALAP